MRLTNRPKSIVITSSIPGEGKSTMAINLAVSLADSGASSLSMPTYAGRQSLSTQALKAASA